MGEIQGKRTEIRLIPEKNKGSELLSMPPMAPARKPLLGYRWFRITKEGNQLLPINMNHDEQYDDNVVARRAIVYPIKPAKCISYRTYDSGLHPPMHRNSSCRCGYYAFKSVRIALDEYGRYVGIVLAEVVMWGLVHHHVDGYRAERMHILNFYEGSSSFAPILARHYQAGLYPESVFKGLVHDRLMEVIEKQAKLNKGRWDYDYNEKRDEVWTVRSEIRLK